MLVDLSLEGLFTPALEIYLERDRSRPSLVLRIGQRKDKEWVVESVAVYDARFTTEAGIGVGSTFEALREKYDVSSIESGESGLYVWIQEIGMSFLLNISFADVPREWHTTRDPTLIPSSAQVSQVLVLDDEGK